MLAYLAFLQPLSVAAITAATRRPVIGICADQASVERSWRVQSVMALLQLFGTMGICAFGAYAAPRSTPPDFGQAGIFLAFAAASGLVLMLLGMHKLKAAYDSQRPYPFPEHEVGLCQFDLGISLVSTPLTFLYVGLLGG